MDFMCTLKFLDFKQQKNQAQYSISIRKEFFLMSKFILWLFNMKLLLYKMFEVLREGKSSIENYFFSDTISQTCDLKTSS